MNDVVIICEMAKEHKGSMTMAKEMITSAADAGANVAKFQSYDKADLIASHKNYEKNVKCHFTIEQLKELSDHCSEVGIDFWCSAFSKSVIKPLSEFTKTIKIPSTFLSKYDFIRDCFLHFPNVHISTGMHNRADIIEAQSFFKDSVFYHCISEYPAPSQGLKLHRIRDLGLEGFSYHGTSAFRVMDAINFGAKFIEVHFSRYASNLNAWLWGPGDIKALKTMINNNNWAYEDNGSPSMEEKENFGFYKAEFKDLI